jgi:putative redox protein
MPTERVSFRGSLGHDLAALLDRPDGAVRAVCLFAHAFGSSKDLRGPARIARALVEKGIATLRFDFTGLGGSGGDFAETTFTSNVGDVRAAAGFLRAELRAPGLLVGHSLGGAAVLVAAAGIPECRAVATIGTPSTTRRLRDRLLQSAPRAMEEGVQEVDVAGNRVRIGRALIEDLARHDLRGAVAGLRRALLLLHSPTDDFVGVEHAAELFRAAKHPKSFVSLDGADHLLLADERDARFVAGVLAAWGERYFGAEPSGDDPSGGDSSAGGPSGDDPS